MRKYNLSINNNPYEVLVKRVSDIEATVEVNGIEHTVAIHKIETVIPASLDKREASTVRPTPATSPVSRPQPTGSGGIIAPMPGQIKAILVREGDKVTAGQKLIVMEAMKLENKLPADRDGIIKHILVRDGDIVNQGQELVIIE
ncbi:MAG: biotin/lipoyl-binding protein [Proteobacteria bacterium]|nr:biotin/lipoyl-binding protein [Pseudomonadota bacterium]MBU1688107.1 biotin/lipoyl-binding protein [Pseudomonadota bacterium]